MEVINKPRSKTFVSLDSLWYEEERLATFIDWPVPYISCRELAQEGFYYLRTKDHCACAFCWGIIGVWEGGDTPRGEHKKHYPHCPFVQGKVTPNVPLKQENTLAFVSREITSRMNCSPSAGTDVCGTGKKDKLESFSEGRVLTKSSSTEISMSSLGFRQYCGPKRKEYLKIEVRLDSFKHWPDKVKQTPEQLAEAGFYYCGLSDHVKCFHCENGLRNWESEDKPWEEHARWFPHCHYVLLQKGIEFVDKVRKERPPYITLRTKQSSSGACTSGKVHFQLTDEEVEKLMELEIIIIHVLKMGFAKQVVKMALKRKVMETGQPFFSAEECIDAILLVMEEETKNTIHGCEDITLRAKEMAAYESSSQDVPQLSSGVGLENRRGSLLPESSSAQSETSSQPRNSSEETTLHAFPSLPNNNIYTPPPSSSPPPLPNVSRASSTPTAQIESSFSPQIMDVEEMNEAMEIATVAEEEPNIETNIADTEGELPEAPEPSRNVEQGNEISKSTKNPELPMELSSEVAPLISEANNIMEEATKLLAPSSSSSSQGSSASSALQEMENNKTTPIETKTETEKKTTKATVQRTENLALELQKMRENLICKVCMDKEMNVVFLPCTHMVTCSSCTAALSACPVCRRDIQYAFKPIIS